MSWPLVLSAAALIFCLVSFFYFRSYIKKHTGSDAVLARIREEINLLLIRVDEITNRDITLLEDKENSLKSLLDETEKRLKVYSGELDRSLRNEKAYRELGRVGAAAVNSVQAEEKPENAVSENKSNPAPRDGRDSPEQKPSGLKAGAASPSIGEEIRRLVNSGFSPRIIASKLGISISEVELAAALMERKPL